MSHVKSHKPNTSKAPTFITVKPTSTELYKHIKNKTPQLHDKILQKLNTKHHKPISYSTQNNLIKKKNTNLPPSFP